MTADRNMKELSDVREYFSHNIRTSTAMVVATVMVFKYGLGEDMENISDVISESAYFLDIYDKGMEICFDFVMGKPLRNDKEELFPSRIISHFSGKLPLTIKEQGIDFAVDLDDFSAKSNAHVVKSIMEIILCEEVHKGRGKMTVSGKDGLYIISKELQPGEAPEIYKIFKKLLGELGVAFSYDDTRLELRFQS